MLFEVPIEELESTSEKYEEKVPPPLSSQFPHKPEKSVVIEKMKKMQSKKTELYPPGLYSRWYQVSSGKSPEYHFNRIGQPSGLSSVRQIT